MQESQLLNNKDSEHVIASCAHVLTFEQHAEHTTMKCVKCGHSENVRYFD